MVYDHGQLRVVNNGARLIAECLACGAKVPVEYSTAIAQRKMLAIVPHLDGCSALLEQATDEAAALHARPRW